MEPSNNTETEDFTTAFKRKRARRVSFADNEITSVHIFRRDDDSSSGTPPPVVSNYRDPEILGFFRDLAGDSDDDDEQELKDSSSPPGGGSVGVRDSFLRPVASPSPGGSSNAGSAASTDDEGDFHGPVSTSFIRPDRLSDSGASDDNHDLTMDSTAFSMHYQSLARSDSGDLKTPTRFGLQFEDKTPSTAAASGSFMELTKAKKHSSQSGLPADAASGGRDSSDMSIEGENPQRYDYDRLSPALNAILAEGSKGFSVVSPLDSKAAYSSNVNGYLMAERSVDSAMGNDGKHDMPVKELAESQCNLGDLNGRSISSPVDQVTQGFLYYKGDSTIADASIHRIQTPDSSIKLSKDVIKGATLPVHKQLDFANANRGTPQMIDEGCQLNVSTQHELGYNESKVEESNPKDIGQLCDMNHKSNQVNGNSIHGFMTLSFSGRKQLFTSSPESSRNTGSVTPPLKQPGSFVPEIYVTHGLTLSSKGKIISKLKTLETTPSTSTLKEGIDRLKSKLSKYSPGTSLFNEKDCDYKKIETSDAPIVEQNFSFTTVNNMHQTLISTDDHGINSIRNFSNLNPNKENVNTKVAKENFSLISVDDSCNEEHVEMPASPLHTTHLTTIVDSDLAHGTVENSKDEIVTVMHDKLFSATDQKLSPSIECQRNCSDELKQPDKQSESVNSGLGQAIECNSLTVADELELSGIVNSEKPRSPTEVAQTNKFAKDASSRKAPNSPAKRVLDLNTPIQETTLLASLQEAPNELLHSNVQDLSCKGNSKGHGSLNHPTPEVAQSPLTKSGSEISSGRKRKGFELPSDVDNADTIGRINRCPEVHESVNIYQELVLEQTGCMSSEGEKLGDQTCNDWADILGKLLGSLKQLLSTSVDKLNLRLIGMLEDILVHLQKVKKCEAFCLEIHSQKITDPLYISRHKRVAEARILLFNVAYEKAKVELLHMKREKLLEKAQQLSSALQESQMMKINFIQCSYKSGAIDTQDNDSHIHSGLLNSTGKCQVSCEKVAEMRQEVEVLDQKAKSLSEFFHSYCKTEGDQSCANTIKYVRDYLHKRMSYKFIFRTLKLWDIEDLEYKDGCYIVLLNYCSYIIQSFTVNAGLHSIIISSKLNDVNFVKSYPHMDALSAFAFVFNPHTTKKYTGSICLAQETQITSSLLGNLLDVVEEVQLAGIEIKNLVQAKFYSHSGQQLDLRLFFIDFRSGRKVQVTLDMTCLKCGVYPVEVLPSHIHDPTNEEQKPLPSSLVDEIRTAAENLRAGYSRIIWLCRCISQAIQACTQNR